MAKASKLKTCGPGSRNFTPCLQKNIPDIFD